jgi:tRNA threonylcarbamoyladenosine biosynthesis protein TsaE
MRPGAEAPGAGTAAFAAESPEATAALGAALGTRLEPGDVVALEGDLGAGKTVFVKGVASGMGIDPEAVTSPTFTLMHVHTGRCPLLHLDLYRIARPDALEAIGWDEAVGGGAVVVIEWAARAGAWLPAERLDVGIETTGEAARRVRVAARGTRPRALLAALLETPAWAARRSVEDAGHWQRDRAWRCGG